MKRVGVITIGLMLAVATAASPSPAPAPPAQAEVLPLSEIRPGMRGYGLTAFKGNEIERFEVEIIGVMEKVAPKQDLILARVEGKLLEHAGIIAGMSGSPIYIDGKLIGALAYAWQFSKDPICGITPIESMLSIARYQQMPPPSGPPLEPVVSGTFLKRLAAGESTPLFAAYLSGLSAFAPAAASGALPIATPLSAAGVSASTLARFGSAFEGLGMIPMASGSSPSGRLPGAPHAPLVPGSPVASVLVGGDMVLAASGTVTQIDGDRVLAFGHPFLELGPVEMPMAHSDVLTVLPSLSRSFKFSTTGEVIGSVRQDRANGILGIVGASARMIPVTVRLSSGGRAAETYHFDVLRSSPLTPLLVAVAVDNVLTSAEKASGDSTIFAKVSFALGGRPPLAMSEAFSGASAKAGVPAYVGSIVQYLIANEFTEAAIDGIELDLDHSDALRMARLAEVTVSDSEVAPGEDITVRARLETYRGESFSESFQIRVPEDAASGKLYLFVGDGQSMDRVEFLFAPPAPVSLPQALALLGAMRPANRLELAVYRQGAGSQVEGETLGQLPPSVASLLHSASGTAHQRLGFYKELGAGRSLPLALEGVTRLDLDVKRDIR